MVNSFGKWWLSGPKYAYSRWRAGAEWDLPIDYVMKENYLNIDKCKTAEDVVNMLRGKVFWHADKFLSIYDVVSSTRELMNIRHDDCDGFSMLHAQALEYVLGPQGCKVEIVSYLADPWWVSHHYAVITYPNGDVYAVQPQPTKEFHDKYGDRNQIIFGPYKSVHDSVPEIAKLYNANVQWYDVRNPKFEKVG